MPFDVNLMGIFFACLFCGVMATHSGLVAVIAAVGQLLFCSALGWFFPLDAIGLAMLVLPSACAAAGAVVGTRIRRGEAARDAAFAAPEPPPGWRPRRRRRPRPRG